MLPFSKDIPKGAIILKKIGNLAKRNVAGHTSSPAICDFDKDGKKDLLVGQFGDGKCRIYRNVGSDEEPSFDGFTWLQAGGEDARMKPG